MSTCLSADELERLAEVDGPPPGAAATHLEGCAACREALEATRRDARLFAELRATVGEPVAPAPGTVRIPGYVLEEELHRGGQGVIYRARQETTRRTVACKLLHAGRDATARERYRFEREVELVASLRHPNIVTIHDSGTADGIPWYVMEFVDGEHLDRHVARVELDQRARLRLFLEVCRAVAFAHQRGVIHRDLKPENVLVTAAGVPVVLDFGIARTIRRGEAAFPLRVTAPGEFMGTLAYASPEQILGHADDIGTTTDVYSLGVMLFELVTGALPFPVDGSMKDTLEHVLHRTPPDAGELRREVDRDLAVLIRKALATEPERRYGSADALARDLERYLDGRPLEAKGDGLGYLLRKALGRHRLALGGAALVALVGAVGLFAFVRERVRAERKESTALEIQAILGDIVAAAQPGRMGAGVTLLEVLDEAGATLQSSLEDAPDSRAAVEFAIGETYWRLRLLEEAERHLRNALHQYRRAEPGGGLATAQALNVLGLVQCYRDDDESIALLEECLEMRRRLLGPDHDLVAAGKRGLAYALLVGNELADPERAERLLEESLSWFEASYGCEHPEVAKTTCRLALAHARRGDRAAAREAYERAWDVFERAGVRDDPIVLECLQSAASIARQEERYEDAERLLQRSFDLAQEAYGDRWMPEILRGFARLHGVRGDAETGLVFARRSLAAELERWARRHRERAPELVRLAAAVRTEDDPPWLEAFEALRDFHRDAPYRLAGWMNEVVLLASELGRAPEVEPLARAAGAQGCHIYGEDCPVRLEALEAHAGILLETGRADEARAVLREASALRARRGWTDGERASWVRATLAELEG